MERKNPQKIRTTFECKKCNYITVDKKDYTKHCGTRKHKMELFGNNGNGKIRTCKLCCKIFSSDSGLWKHTKKCTSDVKSGCQSAIHDHDACESEPTASPDIVMELLKQNQEFKQLIIEQQQENHVLNTRLMEVVREGNTINNNNQCITTTNNNQFNLNFFLNETCKDAMNITDFVNSLKLSLRDLESVGELGYAEGISRMFVKGLSDLEVTKRPIHCSDLKRETLHIKDKDKWQKDNSNQDKLKRAIKDLSNKNIMLFDDWQRENPGYDQYDNKNNDIYLKMMVQAMGPANEMAERRDFGKIIKHIAKSTIIDKDMCV